ncbi:MAG: histidine kinase [Bacteroidetes bacterium]|nr:histidine kinase [Bacteroidota bacterium]
MQLLTSDIRFRVAFGAWLFTWVELQTIILNKYGLPFTTALKDGITSNILLGACCLLITMNMKYYLPKKDKLWYVLIVASSLSTIWLLLSKLVLNLVISHDAAYSEMIEKSEVIRFVNAFLVTTCITLISMLWYTQKEQQETEERKLATERFLKDAELFKLRQQLQPHFLFNSLNSISALTGMQPEKARHMINQLSEFLRGTLKKDEKQMNSFNEEMQYLQLYLEIEKVRFGHRLQTSIVFDDDTLELLLPAMLLQPVVENAIKFGLYDTTGDVTISIKAKKKNNMLEICVQNPFDATTAPPLKGTGFGLASIQRRLFLLFARNDLLATDKMDGYFETIISIPQNVNKDVAMPK